MSSPGFALNMLHVEEGSSCKDMRDFYDSQIVGDLDEWVRVSSNSNRGINHEVATRWWGKCMTSVICGGFMSHLTGLKGSAG